VKNLFSNPEIPQGRNCHVATYSGKGINVKNFHRGEVIDDLGNLEGCVNHFIPFSQDQSSWIAINAS
jgi:hypothetical protein